MASVFDVLSVERGRGAAGSATRPPVFFAVEPDLGLSYIRIRCRWCWALRAGLLQTGSCLGRARSWADWPFSAHLEERFS